MPVQQQTPSDLIRQKRLTIDTNVVGKVKAANLQPSTSTISPIRLSAINSSKFIVTPSQKQFTTGLRLSPITHLKF
jgi:hypothetical protein